MSTDIPGIAAVARDRRSAQVVCLLWRRKSMPQDVIIREFREPDLQAVKRLVDKTIDISYADAYPEEAIAFFKEYHSEAHILDDAADGYMIVLEVGGETIGTGTLSGTTIGRVFVDPSYQHQGLGKAIMRTLEEKALANDVETLDLSASLVAKPFYDSLGYTTQEERSIPVENDQELRYYAMVKRIGDSVE
jgi:GNAT superfamily N-acetyltransferase